MLEHTLSTLTDYSPCRTSRATSSHQAGSGEAARLAAEAAGDGRVLPLQEAGALEGQLPGCDGGAQDLPVQEARAGDMEFLDVCRTSQTRAPQI